MGTQMRTIPAAGFEPMRRSDTAAIHGGWKIAVTIDGFGRVEGIVPVGAVLVCYVMGLIP